MSELIKESYPKNVFIEGNKDGFNSKMAVEKFKISVKKMDMESSKLNLEELQKKYIKAEYKLELVKYESTESNIIIKLSLIEKPIDKDSNRKLLKQKLKTMKKDRNKFDYYKVNDDDEVSNDIFKEYINLKKTCKMPIPEPNEILSNPDQYKPLLNMILNNQMINQMGANHPYIRYFKLIAEKLNVQNENIEDTLEHISEVKPNIVQNKPSTTDDDTDEED
jgi:hypothetical protein